MTKYGKMENEKISQSFPRGTEIIKLVGLVLKSGSTADAMCFEFHESSFSFRLEFPFFQSWQSLVFASDFKVFFYLSFGVFEVKISNTLNFLQIKKNRI